MYFTKDNSWPVSPENYYLVDGGTLQEREYNRSYLDQVRINHLNDEERLNLLKTIEHYSQLFYRKNSNLTFRSATKHRIITKDDIPVFAKTYRYPYIHREEVK